MKYSTRDMLQRIPILKNIFLGLLMFMAAQGQAQSKEGIQNLIDSYYEIISGPAGEARDFDKFRSLFHPKVQLLYSYWENEELKTMFMNVEEYIGKLDYLDKIGFHETELYNQVHSFSSVSQVYSVYEFHSDDKSVQGKGVTGYDIIYDGESYKFIGMYWTLENKHYKIPEVYLTKD